jgi:hypothetical protein
MRLLVERLTHGASHGGIASGKHSFAGEVDSRLTMSDGLIYQRIGLQRRIFLSPQQLYQDLVADA